MGQLLTWRELARVTGFITSLAWAAPLVQLYLHSLFTAIGSWVGRGDLPHTGGGGQPGLDHGQHLAGGGCSSLVAIAHGSHHQQHSVDQGMGSLLC